MSDILLDQEQIKKIIPHRDTMLLVDEITELEPGVLILEALAQTGAVAILSLPEFEGKTGYFGGIDGARFKQKVLPGDTLDLEVEIVKRRGPIGIGKATAYVNGKRAAYGELTFAIG